MFKNRCILYEQFRTKNSGIKTGYMAYHDPGLFFVVYLAYVNMSILDQKYLELIHELMVQGILKNIFLTSIWRTKPLEKILNPKIFITSEHDFINQLWADSPEMSYVSNDANLWESLDTESYANLENAMEG